MRFFFGVKTTKINNFFVMGNLSNPTFVGFFHPEKAAYAFQSMFIIAFAICPILAMRCFAQIVKSIVRSISIDVINLIFGHFSGHIKPSKAMGRIRFAIYFNVNVSLVFLKISSLIAYLHFWAGGCPPKNACFRIIRKRGKKVRMFHKQTLPDYRKDCNMGEVAYV